MTIDQIAEGGFFIKESPYNLGNIAFLSLRTSLKAYYSTYRSMKFELHNFIKTDPTKDLGNHHSLDYSEFACTAIVNFQHFTELIIKDILKRKHILLSIDVAENISIYHDLIEKKDVDEMEIEKIKQIEFSDALSRVLDLLNAGKIDGTKYGFIKEAKPFLSKLNQLRNRIMHRGVYVLSYKSLDYLFSKFALPFLNQVIALDEYRNFKLWQHEKIAISINLIEELIKCTSAKKYHIFKLALLKEIGRAAYENPITHHSDLTIDKISTWDKQTIRQAENIARTISETEYANEAKSCPVCGVKSFVPFNDSVDAIDDEGQVTEVSEIIYKFECYCCTFELHHEINDLDKMGLPIKNYWSPKD